MNRNIYAALSVVAILGCTTVSDRLSSGNQAEITNAINDIATGIFQENRAQQLQNLAMGIDRDARPEYCTAEYKRRSGNQAKTIRKGYDSNTIREAALNGLRTAIEKDHGIERLPNGKFTFRSSTNRREYDGDSSEVKYKMERVERELMMRELEIGALKPVFDNNGVLREFEVRESDDLANSLGKLLDKDEYWPFYISQNPSNSKNHYVKKAKGGKKVSGGQNNGTWFWGCQGVCSDIGEINRRHNNQSTRICLHEQFCDQILVCLMSKDNFVRWSMKMLSTGDRIAEDLLKIWNDKCHLSPLYQGTGKKSKSVEMVAETFCGLYFRLATPTKEDIALVITALKGHSSDFLDNARRKLVAQLDREQLISIVNGDRDEDPTLYWLAWRSVATNEDAVKIWNSKSSKETRREAIKGITDQKLLTEIADGPAYFAPTAIERVESEDVVFTIACNTEKEYAARASASARFLMLTAKEKSEDARIATIAKSFVDSELFIPYYRVVKTIYKNGGGESIVSELVKLLQAQADSIKEDGKTVGNITIRIGDYRLGIFDWEVETLFEECLLNCKESGMRIGGRREAKGSNKDESSLASNLSALFLAYAGILPGNEDVNTDLYDVWYVSNEFGKVKELKFSVRMLQNLYSISEVNKKRWAECFAEHVGIAASEFHEDWSNLKYDGSRCNIEIFGSGNDSKKMGGLQLKVVGNLPMRKKIGPPSAEEYVALVGSAKMETQDPVLLPLADHGFYVGMKMNDAVRLMAKLFPDDELIVVERKNGSVAKQGDNKLLFAYANKDGDVIEFNFTHDILDAMQLDWQYREKILSKMPKDIVKYERKGAVLCEQEVRCKECGDIVIRYYVEGREIFRGAIAATQNTAAALAAGRMMGFSSGLALAAAEEAENDMVKKFQDPNGQFPEKGVLRIRKGERKN